MEKNRVTFRSFAKAKDTDSWLDNHVILPVAFFFTKIFVKLHFIPNVVSCLSCVFGVAGAVLFLFNEWYLNLIGVLCEIICMIFDDCDGQLARLTNHFSKYGRFFDGACDYIVFIAIYVCLALRLQNDIIPFTDVTWGIWIWVVCVVTGLICHSSQTRMADFYRNQHIYYLSYGAHGEFDTCKKIKGKVSFIYYSYTKFQEISAPNSIKLYEAVNDFKDEKTKLVAKEYYEKSKRLVIYTKLLTFNLRAFVLWGCILANAHIIYFGFVIVVMDLLLLIMTISYEKLAKRLLNKYFGEK